MQRPRDCDLLPVGDGREVLGHELPAFAFAQGVLGIVVVDDAVEGFGGGGEVFLDHGHDGFGMAFAFLGDAVDEIERAHGASGWCAATMPQNHPARKALRDRHLTRSAWRF
ncbi:MAG: hypothetical protein CVU73_03270 [Deltaproteobacteria bacterium HGW-Deltaproteobacteria-8]|nr:MAG: hypothetical protein CVU73_03270 [Deltaproteobacteria bacterium HGW-Deltaproteobacteria-8]